MKKTILLLCALWIFLPSLIVGKDKKSSPTSSSKTVHVKEYTRKDGTVVHAHDRAAPATSSHSTSSATSGSSTYSTVPVTHSKNSSSGHSETSSSTYTIERDKHGRIRRSSSAKHEFEKSHPCPSTGKSSGPCPGYVVDHVKALKNGGADDPSNMQWQTTAQAKAKDKWE